jgi:hydrogenase large subunit
MDTKGTQFAFPGGCIIEAGDLAQRTSRSPPSATSISPRASRSPSSTRGTTTTRSGALHPYQGETKPNYTDFKDDAKYSWLKSPTFYGKVTQVGPLARVLNMLAAGHEPTKNYATAALDTVSALAKTKVGLDAMHSTIGRHAARAMPPAVQRRHAGRAVEGVGGNMGKGDLKTFNAAGIPQGRGDGRRLPRGTARRAVALGGHRQRQDQELPVRRALDLERLPAQRARTSRAPTRRPCSTRRSPMPKSRWKCCAPSTPSTRASPAPST